MTPRLPWFADAPGNGIYKERSQQRWLIEPSAVRFDSVRLGSIESNKGCLLINRVEPGLCSVRGISVRVRFDSNEPSSSRTEVLFGSMFVRFDSIGLDRIHESHLVTWNLQTRSVRVIRFSNE